MRQPHQISDMLTTFKMIFWGIFVNVDDLPSTCQKHVLFENNVRSKEYRSCLAVLVSPLLKHQ